MVAMPVQKVMNCAADAETLRRQKTLDHGHGFFPVLII
jgi:hypothetical protein